jgi:hypothetical protein
MCLDCQDDGKIGDKDKCTVCRPGDKFYAPDQICMTSCGIDAIGGFYEVNSDTCDRCNDNCYNCEGDKFNCVQCRAASAIPALLTTTMISGG